MWLKEELFEAESTESVIHETIQMINDIEQYLLGNNYFITMPKEISFKALFKGFIVKDWFHKDIEYSKYTLQNEIIIKEYVDFYQKCWKKRNKIYHDKVRQNKILKEWC